MNRKNWVQLLALVVVVAGCGDDANQQDGDSDAAVGVSEREQPRVRVPADGDWAYVDLGNGERLRYNAEIVLSSSDVESYYVERPELAAAALERWFQSSSCAQVPQGFVSLPVAAEELTAQYCSTEPSTCTGSVVSVWAYVAECG